MSSSSSRRGRAARGRKPPQPRSKLNPEADRRAILADETGTLIRDAPYRIALTYPNPYSVAMSSLGYQVIYRMLNQRPELAAERVVLPDDVEAYRRRGAVPVALESGRPLSAFDLLAFSLTYDLDITGFFDLLDLAGVPIERADRGPRDPPILLGGPLTASNALPFGRFIDLAVIGDGEAAVDEIADILAAGCDRTGLVERAATIPGVWVPEIHGDAVPATQKVTTGYLPAYGQIVTPRSELSSMFLIEASRGCPRYCKFCLVRAPESPMREAEVEEVLARVPEGAPRVGFVGAAISEWHGIRRALAAVVVAGKGVGISSLRAEQLDPEFVGLLRRGGYRTMTVASDAPSQRQRNQMAKALKARDLVNAARLARDAGMTRLKMYVIVGLPGEEEGDIDELVELCRELRSYLPLALGVSPLVPKLHTPLGDARFAGIRTIDRTLGRLRKELAGVADLRSTSARWAWVEYRMSQGGQDAGKAALAAWRGGGSFAAWKSAFEKVEERGALRVADEHRLFAAAGMR